MLNNLCVSHFYYGKNVKFLHISDRFWQGECNNFNIGIRSIIYYLHWLTLIAIPVFYLIINNFISLIFLTLVNIHTSGIVYLVYSALLGPCAVDALRVLGCCAGCLGSGNNAEIVILKAVTQSFKKLCVTALGANSQICSQATDCLNGVF